MNIRQEWIPFLATLLDTNNLILLKEEWNKQKTNHTIKLHIQSSLIIKFHIYSSFYFVVFDFHHINYCTDTIVLCFNIVYNFMKLIKTISVYFVLEYTNKSESSINKNLYKMVDVRFKYERWHQSSNKFTFKAKKSTESYILTFLLYVILINIRYKNYFNLFLDMEQTDISAKLYLLPIKYLSDSIKKFNFVSFVYFLWS